MPWHTDLQASRTPNVKFEPHRRLRTPTPTSTNLWYELRRPEHSQNGKHSLHLHHNLVSRSGSRACRVRGAYKAVESELKARGRLRRRLPWNQSTMRDGLEEQVPRKLRPARIPIGLNPSANAALKRRNISTGAPSTCTRDQEPSLSTCTAAN